MKHSTLLVLILDKTATTLKYMVVDTPGIKTHIMPHNSTFNYSAIKIGSSYCIRCDHIDNIWNFVDAYPINLSERI